MSKNQINFFLFYHRNNSMINSNFFSFYCKKFFQYNNNEITCFINYNSIFTLFNAIFLLSLFSEIKIENKHSKFY